uniref:TatC-like protein n=1 Tax=Jaagichlorella roystonensis TaxID=1052852 RepID=A0A6C0M7I4_9CHLO|nr:tatC-like protein [Jaagichlorella roystonensis]QHU78354.1 tatC-like protein [Jaagichlorella roystonensis]
MISNNKTRLNTLYWEIKTRFYYIFFSFILSFLTCYKNSIALLYLFVSSYENQKAFAMGTKYCNQVFTLSWTLPKEIIEMVINAFSTLVENVQKTKGFWLYEIPKEITTCRQYPDPDLSVLNEKELLTFLDTLNGCGTTSIKFIFTDVEEAFSSTISICLIFSFIFCFFYIVYVVFAFLAPSMYCYETTKWFRKIVLFIFIWIAFIIYLQRDIIPKLAHFLLKFQIQSVGFSVEAETKIYSYCVWASTIFLIANLIFFLFFLLFLP